MVCRVDVDTNSR
jgi:hypothetical protein